jgi:type 1 glutamine amidotransferase
MDIFLMKPHQNVIHPRVIFLLITLVFILLSFTQKGDPMLEKILVITGGHEFETSFFEIFDSFIDVKYDTISQPRFNQMINTDLTNHYSAFVFYDMWQDISPEQKQAFLKLLDKGQGVVFLHHSLVSYQHWDEFIEIVGGKYVETEFYDDPNMKGSTYKEDISLDITVLDKNHPVTKDVTDFSIVDEGYQFIEMLPKIHKLLSTSHPDCTPTVGWTNEYKNSRIVYILLGHGQESHENPNYRKLIRNAISWVDRKSKN